MMVYASLADGVIGLAVLLQKLSVRVFAADTLPVGEDNPPCSVDLITLNIWSEPFSPVTVNACAAHAFAATATGERFTVMVLNSSHVCPALTLKLFRDAFAMAGDTPVTIFVP